MQSVLSSNQETFGSFIHGEMWKSKDSAETLTLIQPKNATPMGKLVLADHELIEQAISSAKQGFEVWRNYAPAQRAKVLTKAAEILASRAGEIATLECINTGKPISETSEVDVTTAVDALRYFGNLCETERSDFIDLGESYAFTKREPLGICLGIAAWNYPIQIASWKAAPALACGNAMIFKPSELTPMTALVLAEVFIEAGLPAGVFNVVQGDHRVGKALVEHPDINKISLTGSVATGEKIASTAGKNLTPVTMELGGKSPLIVCDDADLENAVSGALLANFYSSGQVCSNGTRVFVQEGIYSKFKEALLERVKRIKIGDPENSEVTLGPLVSEQQYKKVLSYIKLGQQEGAKLLCGGEHPFSGQDHPLANGYYVSPVVFEGCTDQMRVVQEEIFGPVMCILKYKSESEVIDRANRTEFGLSAGIFTSDIKTGYRMIAQVNAGTCWINNYNVTPLSVPFGGIKKSGFGRENAKEALDSYSQLKSVYVEMSKVESPF